jgi:two-component system OmpR family response regulator
MRALIVDDEKDMLLLGGHLLEKEGFTVDTAITGEEAIVLASVNDYDAVVLDLGLPDRHGLTVIQQLRRRQNKTPILVLTGNSDRQMTVQALNAGADDYVTKPIDAEEFQARIRALVRRGGAQRTETLSSGNLVFNRLTRQALIAGKQFVVTAREMSVLEHFLLHSDQVVTRTTLLEKVWDMNFDPGSNVVDVCVARLRKKLGDSGATLRIGTRRGMGFVLSAAANPPDVSTATRPPA